MHMKKDDTGRLVIDGMGTITFYRKPEAVKVDVGVQGVFVCYWTFYGLNAATRIKRFMQAMPKLWVFCK